MSQIMPWDQKSQDEEAAKCRTYIDPKEDRCRHELTPETDLNVLLRRYQPWELPAKETFYGERDYDLDPHDAVQANRAAWEFWSSKDDAWRGQFGTFGQFLNSEYAEIIEAEKPAEEKPAEKPAE